MVSVFIFSWVSNGIVGSPAFAAYDHGMLSLSSANLNISYDYRNVKMLSSFSGYDVYLGNFRGRVSKKHINKKLSSRQ